MFDDSVSTVYSSIWASMNSWFTPTVLFVLLNVMIGTIAFTSSLSNQKQNHEKQQQQQQQQQQEDYSQSQPQQQEDYSKNQPQQRQPAPKVARSFSLLQRIKSINFYSYRSQEPVKNYNFDHQQETPFEPPTHYIFEPAPEQTTIEPETTHYIFDQENNVQKTQTQSDFQQIHQESLPETQTQYLFPEKSTQYIFQQAHGQKHGDMETRFDSQQIEEEEEDEDEGELKSLDEVYNQLTERHVSRSRSDTKPSAGEAPAKMKKSASMKSPFAHFEEAIVEVRRPATTRERNTKNSDGDNEVDAKADDFINKFKQQLKLQRVDSILRYKEMISRGS